MILVVLTGVLSLTLVSYLCYKSDVNWTLKASVLTLSLLTGTLTYENYQDNLGSPINQYPTFEFVYIYHINTKHDTIQLWIYDADKDRTRLYEFPYDRETSKELEKAKEKAQEGQQTQGEFTEATNHRGDTQMSFGLVDPKTNDTTEVKE